MRRFNIALFLVVAALLLAGTAGAGLLASYDMAGSPDVSGDDNDAAAVANLTVSNITEGTTDWRDGNDQWSGYKPGTDSIDGQTWWIRGSQIESPAASDDYAQFSLTVAEGYQLELDSISADLLAVTADLGVDVSFNLNVYTSTNGFATAGVDQGDLVHPGGLTDPDPDLKKLLVSDSLSLASLDPFTGTVTFRLFIEDTAGSTSGSDFANIDTVGVTGSVSAIPEPASLGLIFLFGSIALLRRHLLR